MKDSYITIMPSPTGFLVALITCINDIEEDYIVSRSWHLKSKAVALIKAHGMAERLQVEMRGIPELGV